MQSETLNGGKPFWERNTPRFLTCDGGLKHCEQQNKLWMPNSGWSSNTCLSWKVNCLQNCLAHTHTSLYSLYITYICAPNRVSHVINWNVEFHNSRKNTLSEGKTPSLQDASGQIRAQKHRYNRTSLSWIAHWLAKNSYWSGVATWGTPTPGGAKLSIQKVTSTSRRNSKRGSQG